jgi:hypothetical protein
MHKWDCIRLKSFCTEKDIVTRHNRLSIEWEKIFASFHIYRELKKLNLQIINILMKTWTHELKRKLSKEVVQMARKYMKKHLTFLAIKEMQIKTTLRFHLTPVKMAMFKGNNNIKCWQGDGKTGTPIFSWWECKFVKPVWKAVCRFLKKLKV